MRFQAFGLALFLAFSATGFGSAFDQVAQLFDQGVAPPLADFRKPSLWVGKVVAAHSDVVVNGMFAVHPESDPIVAEALHLIPLSEPHQGPDFFLTISKAEIESYYSRTRLYFSDFTTLSTVQDPLLSEIQFRHRSGALSYGLRSSKTAAGLPLYLIAERCAVQGGCTNGLTGEWIPFGQTLDIGYFWVERLNAP